MDRYVLELEVAPHASQKERRLDVALLSALRARAFVLSRSDLKSWFQEGVILWRGKKATASQELAPGLHLIEILRLPGAWQEASTSVSHALPSARGSFLPILYEDHDLLVIHKESGIPSVPLEPTETETAVGSALAHTPTLRGVGSKPLEPGLLHRLDTGTSGCLAFAKNADAHRRLWESWRTGEVRKLYRAITSSKDAPKTFPFEITTPLGHDSKSKKRMLAITDLKRDLRRIRGKPLDARTRILSALPLSGGRLDLTIEIHTGVMHQIRAHLSSLGIGILGDPIYGAQHDKSSEPRLWLHAWRLEVPRPGGEDPLEIEAPLPENWPK